MKINLVNGLTCVGKTPNEWLDHPANVGSIQFNEDVINIVDSNEAPVGVKHWLMDEYGGGVAFYGHCPESGQPVHLVFCDHRDVFAIHHEIGHVVLGHTKMLLDLALSGKSLTDEDSLSMEFEADEYASRIVGVSRSMIALSAIFDQNPNRGLREMFAIKRRMIQLSMLL